MTNQTANNMKDSRLPRRTNKAVEDYLVHKTNLANFVLAGITYDTNNQDNLLRDLEDQLEKSLQYLLNTNQDGPLENIDIIELVLSELAEETELSSHHKELISQSLEQLRRFYFSASSSSKHEKRTEPRVKQNKFGVISVDDATLCRFMTKDISNSGACLYVEHPDLLPDEFSLLGIGVSKQVLASKVWSKANEIGIEFKAAP
ncbi:MAG: PilZ domain-containing protein [Lentilitoribacter sp.]